MIVRQHGCGERYCKSRLTGAFDLPSQAPAKKHDCAVLAPSYEQPEKADCQMWCDSRTGSAAAFQKCLIDLGTKSGHLELAEVSWALWGHSAGGIGPVAWHCFIPIAWPPLGCAQACRG